MEINLGLIVATVSLVVSIATAWLTLFRRGTVHMTQPTTIFFGPDRSKDPHITPPSKIYLRSLLYGTAKRGRIIENMFVRLKRGETAQNFNIWVYGDNELKRGSGLYIPDSGITANHHFLPPKENESFQFLAGLYDLEIYASLVGSKKPLLLYAVKLELSQSHAEALKTPASGVYFDWGPDSRKYYAHIKYHPSL